MGPACPRSEAKGAPRTSRDTLRPAPAASNQAGGPAKTPTDHRAELAGLPPLPVYFKGSPGLPAPSAQAPHYR